MTKNNCIFKLIALLLAFSIISQNISWADYNKSNTSVSNQKTESEYLAPLSNVENLLPQPSRRSMTADIARRERHLNTVLEDCERALSLPEETEETNEGEYDLTAGLNEFFTAEQAVKLAGLKENKDVSEELLLDYTATDKFFSGQAEDIAQCMNELISNALDAVLTAQYGTATKTSGRHGLGLLQVFGELKSRDNLVILESWQKDKSQRCVFMFYINTKGQIVFKKRTSACAANSAGGTVFTVIKDLNKVERKRRKRKIKDSFCINTSAPIRMQEGINGSESVVSDINNLSGYGYLNCSSYSEIDQEVNPVLLRLNRYGYQVTDSGTGMTEEDILKRALKPRSTDKIITKQSKAERDQETGLLSRGTAAQGKVHVWLNGRLVGIPIGAAGAEVSAEIHFVFPHSARALMDWKRLEMNSIEIEAFKSLCRKLTSYDTEASNVDRYARLQSMVYLINYYQPPDSRETAAEEDNLIEYLKKQINNLLAQKDKDQLIVLPNLSGCEDIDTSKLDEDKEVIYLHPDIYDFSDGDFAWMHEVDEEEVLGLGIRDGVKIFLADFKDDSELVFLQGESSRGEYLIIDSTVWNKSRNGQMFTALMQRLYPRPSGAAERDTGSNWRRSLKKAGHVFIALTLIGILMFAAVFGLNKVKEATSQYSIGNVKEPALVIGNSSPHLDNGKKKRKEKNTAAPQPVLTVTNTGNRIGPEDTLLLPPSRGFYFLGDNGATVQDTDARFVPQGEIIDYQDVRIHVKAKTGELIRLLTGDKGKIDFKTMLIQKIDGSMHDVKPEHIVHGIYLRITPDIAGDIFIVYKSDIYESVTIENLDQVELPERERLDAEDFFGFFLAQAAGVKDLDAVRALPDNLKIAARNKVRYMIFNYDSREAYAPNGRSLSSTAREKIGQVKGQMGLICNGVVAFDYIMDKIMGIDAVMVKAEQLESQKLMPGAAGHVVLYEKIDGVWRLNNSVEGKT